MRMIQNKKKPNRFHNFQQRDYDWDALENKLLGNAAASPPTSNTKTATNIKPYVAIIKELDESTISDGAFRLYYHLLVLEDRYKLIGKEFYHTQSQLCNELHHAKGTIEKYLNELEELGLIKIRFAHYQIGDKKSDNRVSYFTILVHPHSESSKNDISL